MEEISGMESTVVTDGLIRSWTREIKDCGPEFADSIGGKALGLGQLHRAGLPVPPGFVVTTDAYRECVVMLLPRIAQLLGHAGSLIRDRTVSAEIEHLFIDAIMTAEIRAAIDFAYDSLSVGQNLPVAVRSSATAEDMAGASFAGQQETYLWIFGAAAVRHRVVKCWASLFTARAIEYRARMKVPLESLAMGVVVQTMVPAEAAGVMMTLHPVTGDRSQIYIESALGLGEIVVRGEVEPDRFEIDKEMRRVRTRNLGNKTDRYAFDAASGEVRLMPVPEPEQKLSSLHDDDLAQLADLGLQIEAVFGRPMDIEWAIDKDSDGRRRCQLLQARPETVWSERQMEEEPADVIDRHDDWDILQSWSPPHVHWSTDNAGEAAPGALTPLSWSVWGPAGELALREACFLAGILTEEERRLPESEDKRYMHAFYGRMTLRVDFFALMGDRIPGTTGQAMVRDILGRLPEMMEFHPTKQFYPWIAMRMPAIIWRFPKSVGAMGTEYHDWWLRSCESAGSMSAAEAVQLMNEARQRFAHALTWSTIAVMVVVQPLLEVAGRLARKAGVDPSTLTGVSGNAEVVLVHDLWRASRDEIQIEQIVKCHGFHGPLEGELQSRVWREDATPLRRMIEQYAKRADRESPVADDSAKKRERESIRQRMLASMPAFKRPFVARFLDFVNQRVTRRGVPKRCSVQAFDVMRASARRIGELRVAEGLLDQTEDVLFLTAEELSGPWPSDAKTLVQRRRARRAAYQKLHIPGSWTGMPQATPIGELAAEPDAEMVHGIGVSAGIVEGIVRVVLDPSFVEVGDDEILVAPTTDPSWSSIMFISAAVIVDIGGALSHAAVVARELRIPCVVNTRVGTQMLRTGDRVRVDGGAGTIHILERAAA